MRDERLVIVIIRLPKIQMALFRSEVVNKGVVYGMMKGSRKREQDPCEYGGMRDERLVIVIIRLPKQQMALK